MLNYLTKPLYKKKNSRKAVSPVISTIIIVAIAIAISIAVALYLTGITSTFTKFERLDVTSAYANPLARYNSSIDAYKVEITVKNSGTSALSIDRLLINGKPENTQSVIDSAGDHLYLDGSGGSGNTIPISQGEGDTVITYLLASTYKSGQSLELTFHTVSGKEYPKVVVLP